MKINFPKPNVNETPLVYADRIGEFILQSKNLDTRKKYAQYFTPTEAATLMANLFDLGKGDVDILDPGAGSGVLACAICEFIASHKNNEIKKINLTIYEIDSDLIVVLKKTLEYLIIWLHDRKIELEYEIHNKDFILENSDALNELTNLFSNVDEPKRKFDFIISNPPYFKLSKTDPRVRALNSVVHGQPNIYALFMILAAFLLKDGGEMVFITPRSYAAGPYFRLFRERLFSIVSPKQIHVFCSRKETFERDKVLQENIILKAKKKYTINENENVIISHSLGCNKINKRTLPLHEVLDFNSKGKVMRLPISEEDDMAIKVVHNWKDNLLSHKISISTGPIVAFRSKKFLATKEVANETFAPLLWMQNVKSMKVEWPLNCRKEQYIKIEKNSKKLLLPNDNYILLRRFSSKEEKQRLVAGPYLKKYINYSDFIGLENHLNYIYRPGGSLSPKEVFGISAILNSKLLDRYFRTYNGNTQVSATEIKNMPLPPIEFIKEIGEKIIKNEIKSEGIDELLLTFK